MKLPYTVSTATGDKFEIEFPLHENTEDAVKVSHLITAILRALDNELKLLGSTGNGDVLQATAMALAIRARMIHAPEETVTQLTSQLISDAFEAAFKSERTSPQTGHG
ncbi:MAG: hypothetical protein RLZ98_2599 [Pseudomonadota bacterium]